jgi:hypothetical protein
MDAGDEDEEVARRENKNGVHAGIEWVYRGVIDCAVGHREV